MSFLELSGIQKVAIIMTSLSKDQILKVLCLLSEDEVAVLSKAISDLKKVRKKDVKFLCSNFLENIDLSDIENTIQETETLITKIQLEKNIFPTKEHSSQEQAFESSLWKKFEACSLAASFEFLKEQDAQTIAIILSKIDPKICAKILSFFSQEVGVDILVRISQMKKVSTDALAHIQRLLEEFLENYEQYDFSKNQQIVANVVECLGEKFQQLFLQKETLECPYDNNKSSFKEASLFLMNTSSIENIMHQLHSFSYKELMMLLEKLSFDASAIVLSKLPTVMCQKVLKGLAIELRDDLVQRIVKLPLICESIIEEIENAMLSIPLQSKESHLLDTTYTKDNKIASALKQSSNLLVPQKTNLSFLKRQLNAYS